MVFTFLGYAKTDFIPNRYNFKHLARVAILYQNSIFIWNMSNDYFDFGFDLFKREPDLMLVEVWRRATSYTGNFGEQHEVVEGYREARRQRDEYRRTK